MRVFRKASNASRREAILQSKAQSRIMASGNWLTWPELHALLPASVKGRNDSCPDRLLEGAILSISYEGVEYFPRYAIESRSLAVAQRGMQRVIAVLGTRMSGWSMALWFESSNSYLAGQLPKDLISSDLDAVVKAAQDEIDGSSHG